MIRDLQLGTAVAIAYGEGGFLGVQTDAFGKSPGTHGRQVVGQFGLMGRPLDSDGEDGALVLYADEGAEGFAWIGFDGRIANKLPELTSGSTAFYNSRGAYQLLDYETETYTLYVPVDEGDGIHIFTVGKDQNGRRTISLSHADGMTIALLDNKVMLTTKDGATSIECTTSKITVAGPTVHIESPNVLLGAGASPIACVGDIVSLILPLMVAGPYPVVVMPPPAEGAPIPVMGRIISGRSGAKA
jgi:hypothetical protein